MDLIVSIADLTAPLSLEIDGSVDEIVPVGSSAIDTLVNAALLLPRRILEIMGAAGADLGSTAGQPI